MDCPCGTGFPLADCCGPLLAGERAAPTAEALMRSRYSAFALKQTAYLVETHDPRTRDQVDVEATEKWAARTRWLGLEVLATEAGGETDTRGEVEFVARYQEEGGRESEHRERSTFVREGDRWFYEEGTIAPRGTLRAEPRIGRNDPCPCGSGKKHKKCCGAPGRRAG